MIKRDNQISVVIADDDAERNLASMFNARRGVRGTTSRPASHYWISKTSIANSLGHQLEHDLVVIASRSQLGRIAVIAKQANRENKLRALLIRDEGVEGVNAVLHALFDADLRTLRNTLVHSGEEVPRRILGAWKVGAQHQLIADAYVVDDKLTVTDCALKRYTIGFDDLGALRRMPRKQRTQFEIDVDGSFLYWPASDVHIGLEMVRGVVDPAFQRVQMRKYEQELKQLGTAIATVRKARGLTQTDIAGLSERQLRRIENGHLPSETSFRVLAKAHGLSLGQYLNALAVAMRKSDATSESIELLELYR